MNTSVMSVLREELKSIPTGTLPKTWVNNLVTVPFGRENLFMMVDYHQSPEWGYCLIRVEGVRRDTYLNRDGSLDVKLGYNLDRYFDFTKPEDRELLKNLLEQVLADSANFVEIVREAHNLQLLQLPESGLDTNT